MENRAAGYALRRLGWVFGSIHGIVLLCRFDCLVMIVREITPHFSRSYWKSSPQQLSGPALFPRLNLTILFRANSTLNRLAVCCCRSRDTFPSLGCAPLITVLDLETAGGRKKRSEIQRQIVSKSIKY